MKKMTFALLFIIASSGLYADKSSVEIQLPASVKAGKEIIVKINVFHKGNNAFHHTSWVYLKINGKEAVKWKYPFESENFTKEFKFTPLADFELEAMADCNLHGSAGAVTKKVTVKK